MAVPCFGQFTEIWTNGELFAVEKMASQCYSASVERCSVAGVTPNDPSWWDYIVGKNHAKLVSVKANIAACVPYYVGTNVNVTARFDSAYSATFTNAYEFLSACGLPTNSLTETPYFKSQYPSVTGGWVSVKTMLQNMVYYQKDFSPHFSPPSEFLSKTARSFASFEDAYSNRVDGAALSWDAGFELDWQVGDQFFCYTVQPVSNVFIAITVAGASAESSYINTAGLSYYLDLYAKVTKQNAGTGTQFFDLGYGVTTNYQKYATLFSASWTNAPRPTVIFTNDVPYLTNYIPAYQGDTKGMGWSWTDTATTPRRGAKGVYRLNVTNGFKFK